MRRDLQIKELVDEMKLADDEANCRTWGALVACGISSSSVRHACILQEPSLFDVG
jgi:hypothetical protein